MGPGGSQPHFQPWGEGTVPAARARLAACFLACWPRAAWGGCRGCPGAAVPHGTTPRCVGTLPSMELPLHRLHLFILLAGELSEMDLLVQMLLGEV